MVRGDAMRIRQVLVNLAGNAIKFTQKGEVAVSLRARPLQNTRPDEFELHFTVRDTGIGISPEKQAAIFQAFTQADTSTTRQYGGTGLGLAISKRLIEMMGGRISVESKLNSGSIFTFTAPVTRAHYVRKDADPNISMLYRVPILIVDDNATNRRILANWVSQWGMWPILAESAAAALQLLESVAEPVRFILTDVHMPEMDGFELIKNARILSRVPTVIMLTSASHPGDIARSRELGAEGYLIKPVRRNDLLEIMLHVLAPQHAAPPSEGNGDEEARNMAPAAGNPNGSLHILIAEDNLINQRYAREMLERRGHSTVVARNGREAVAALQREKFDLVLMDVQMPEMDGFEATSEIRAQESFSGGRIPIIAMTAHALSGDRDKCLAAGMDAYVAKPIRGAELFATIASVISGRGSAEAVPVLSEAEEHLA